jgi:hypothetical protein
MPLPPQGITPPTPGLDHEEPEMMLEEADIPDSEDAPPEDAAG